MDISTYNRQVEECITDFLSGLTGAKKLYQPVEYMLSMGGKRVRPSLLMMACDAFSGDPKPGVNAAAAIEMFHNFTLMHDDIMDKAPIRRGKATVHMRWNQNTAILSGDVMMILAYDLLSRYPDNVFATISRIFNKAGREVCEGQQMDMNFETREEVFIEEYIRMIELKTSVLMGAALQIGAVIAGADTEQQTLLYNFGVNLGIAFQLQDDYLDSFGNQKIFGKRIGGDIVENKKTFLRIKAYENANDAQRAELLHFERSSDIPEEQKIEGVKKLFVALGAADQIRQEIASYARRSEECIDSLNIGDQAKAAFRNIVQMMLERQN